MKTTRGGGRIARQPFGGRELPGVTAAVSSRSQGNMSLRWGDTRQALENRAVFLRGRGIEPASLVCARQVHGAAAALVDERHRGSGALSDDNALAAADALITNVPAVPVAVLTADCLPIFLYDPRHHAAAVVHAGRRGTLAGIAALSLTAMGSAFGTLPGDTLVSFGPCIRRCCYEVSPECARERGSCGEVRDGRFYFDLIEANRRQLLAAGAVSDNITDCGICTACDAAGCFSFRREGSAAGRMIAILMLGQNACISSNII